MALTQASMSLAMAARSSAGSGAVESCCMEVLLPCRPRGSYGSRRGTAVGGLILDLHANTRKTPRLSARCHDPMKTRNVQVKDRARVRACDQEMGKSNY